MSTHREEYADRCAGWALGFLDDADRARFEAHLATGCPECEAVIADFSKSVMLLAASSPPAWPRPELRAQVLEAARREVPAHPATVGERPAALAFRSRGRRSYAAWAWAAAAVVFAVATAASWSSLRRMRDELSAARSQLARAERELEETRRWAAVLGSPRARVVDLAPTPGGAAALRARAIWEPRTGSAVVVFENFTPPPGSDYQLWVIGQAGPISLGLVRPDGRGRAELRLENVGRAGAVHAFAVSLEREGGSTNPHAPQGPVVMLGSLGG